ncbi:MAG TPA: hypothetical protein PKA10_18410 [Selenomonadales bacterium]|nr:hypothetical protein [Selenomonadales bacterium]
MTIYSGKPINPYTVGVKNSNPSNRGFISNPRFGPRSQAPLSGRMIDWIYALKTTKTRQGFRLTGMQKGARIVRKLKGIYAGRLVIGARKSVKNGLYVSREMRIGARKVRVVAGRFLHPLFVDSNASGQIGLMLTPTFTYADSAITLEAHSTQPIVGKYSLTVNGVEVIPFQATSADITNIAFDIDLSQLTLGNNNCILSIKPDVGIKKFLNFIISSETIDRQVSEQKIRLYSGGWDISGDVSRRYLPFGGARDATFVVTDPGKGGVITTTDKTAVRTSRNKGLLGVNIAGAGCRYLVSFDRRNTWYAWDGSGFVATDPSQIATAGMTETVLAGTTRLQWAAIFSPTQLDFMIYFSSTVVEENSDLGYSASGSVGTNGVKVNKTFSIPAHFVVTQIDLVNNGYGSARVFYTDKAGVNHDIIPTTSALDIGSAATIYSGLDVGEVTNQLSVEASYSYFIGQYQFSLVTYGYYRSYVSNIQVLLPPNLAPAITEMAITPSSLHAESPVLTAHIKDPDGDPAQYRVLVNGEVLQDYNSDSTNSEYDISVIIPNDRLIVGTNAIAVQTHDSLTYGTPYTTYLTKVDARPSVSGVLDKLDFTAVITDEDSEDRVRYRIWVNGVVKVDWTEFAEPPVNVYFKVDQRDVVIGRQNTVTLEVQDDIGGVTSVDFDFVGQGYGVKKYAVIM